MTSIKQKAVSLAIIVVLSIMIIVATITIRYVFHAHDRPREGRSQKLTRVFITNAKERKAVCNDGSPATIYVKRNVSSGRWLFFLSGGGACFDKTSCASRYTDHYGLDPTKGWLSSNSSSPVKYANGLFNSNCTINPGFCEANYVIVPYCSSDAWAGDFDLEFPNVQKGEFTFHGAAILKASFEDALYEHGMEDAAEIYVAGESAGAVGALVAGDFLHTLVPNNQTVWGVISDSGWLNSGRGYRASTCINWISCPLEEYAMRAISYLNITPNVPCTDFYGEEFKWKCFFGVFVFPYLESRLLILISLHDPWVAMQDTLILNGLLGWTWPLTTKSEVDWIFKRGVSVVESVKDVENVFATGCITHSLVHSEVTVDGITGLQAIGDFVNGEVVRHIDVCTRKDVKKCGTKCPKIPLKGNVF